METGKVIKPPIEAIKSGKVFKPSRAFIYKGWLGVILLALALWVFAMLTWLGTAYLVLIFDDGIPFTGYVAYLNYWWMPVNFWWWVANAFWLVPALIIWPFYVKRFEYSVIALSGETMPEIYVRKGIVTVTEKHVPFRTITNISSKAGPMDRLFGIGSVEIQTAGFSGGAQAGAKPEEKLEGLQIFESVRDFVLRELRRFTGQYVTGTEVLTPSDMPAPAFQGNIQDEILITLREIRDSVAPIREVLDELKREKDK
ncbi:MAG: PH domain-containing protein [Candidatus Thorarchaeota archaeon]|nr:MAG: PH domain-containing protein [Candidatus Thorarchaeota archaeon]